MFYASLILSHHCTNNGNNEKFITIDICLNYVFLIVLARRLPMTPVAFNVLI